MKTYNFPVKYKLGGQAKTLTAGVTKNKAIEPTRAVRARFANRAARAVEKSTGGQLGFVRIQNANLPSHRRLRSVKNGKYAYAAVQI